MRCNRDLLTPQRLAAVPLAILLALLASMVVVTPVSGSGDSLSLQITNGSSFAYGACPHFHVKLILATKLQANYSLVATIQLDGGQRFGAPMTTESADGLTYTFDTCQAVDGNGQPFQPGDYVATASFLNPETRVTTQSNQVPFTVMRASSTVSCNFTNPLLFVSPGTALQVVAILNGQDQGAPQGTQFSLSFSGPASVTYSPLSADASGSFSVPAPTQPGVYSVTCAFLGNSLYSGSSSSMHSVTVSQKRQLGGARLYTDPTTLVANKAIQMYVLFKAAPGGPTPRGYFSITVGQYSTAVIKLRSDGSALIKLDPIPRLPSPESILVWYQGDPYYNIQSFTFPATNPPIPGGGGGGSSATPTPTGAAATGTATADDSATPVATPTTSVAMGITATDQSGSSLVLWLAGIFGLLIVLGAGAGVAVYVVRRRRASHVPLG